MCNIIGFSSVSGHIIHYETSQDGKIHTHVSLYPVGDLSIKVYMYRTLMFLNLSGLRIFPQMPSFLIECDLVESPSFGYLNYKVLVVG